MDKIYQELANLDKLIHEPARLAILTALMSCKRADFLFLQRLTGLTAGNLSTHITRLEEAGLIRTKKRFVDRRPNTLLELTVNGAESIAAYWKKFDKINRSIDNLDIH